MRPSISLAGHWKYRADPHGLGEYYPEQLAYTHADDARWMDQRPGNEDWQDTTVPGRWPLDGVGRETTVWFSRQFSADPSDGGSALIFDGINYFSDIWLNGHFLGSHEGYLGRIRLDTTGLLARDNLLVLRVTPPGDVIGQEDQMNQLKHHFVGALGRWDMNDPETKPAGIWGDVRLVRYGRAAIESAAFRYEVSSLPKDQGALVPIQGQFRLAIGNASERAQTAQIKWSIKPKGFDAPVCEGAKSLPLFPGQQSVAIDAEFEARLWWTWDLGTPHLYDVEVDLVLDGVASDRKHWSTGFRTLALGPDWTLKLNGVSLYQRGANYLSDLDLSSMTDARYEQDVTLFRQANLNTVHPFCLVEGDGLYKACDELGLIVYQDFPLWLMADTSSDLVRRALIQFEEMLARLDASPSVAVWNFGSQPSIANVDKLCLALARHARNIDPSRIAHLGNAAVAYDDHDDVHPVTSFFWTEESARRFEEQYGWQRDSHMYPGWYFGDISSIRDLPRHHFALVTEFGAQALPNRENLAQFLSLDEPIDWRTIARRCGQPRLLQRHNPEAKTVSELIARSQAYQARLIRHHIEFIRSLKGQPGHGLHVFAFNDCWPSVTWSMVDYDRVPKPSYHAAAQAMAPVQAFLMTRLESIGSGPTTLVFAMVNDLAAPLDRLVLTISLDSQDRQVARATASIDTLGTEQALALDIAIDVPQEFEALTLIARIEDDTGTVLATNRYKLADQE